MLLEIQNVSKIYRTGNEQVVALDEASLSLDVGEFTAVAGPSGCGKTTLLLIAGGLLAPENGRVTIEGQDPYTLPADERAAFRADNIGFVFQQFHLIPYLSVLDNILTAAIPTNLPDARERAM
ncbi:MAG: ATP-binding cassette domain-containing protein, partial [Planctomycetes bacterium]|nr:ATP-binding cassette domain-containing protein [Planctomycetota bacterium]